MKVKIFIMWCLIIVSLVVSMYPLFEYFTSDLSRLDIFKKWWYLEIGGFGLAIFLLGRLTKFEKK
tara:strand:+ start:73 stop:267 length:195 start_codon:yes stop_codon:yes gene_type:complete